MDSIDFCIRYLLAQQGADIPMPRLLVEKRNLLRALMNVWRPQPLSAEFLDAQNRELHSQLMEKGIVRLADIDDTNPLLWQGDITRLQVDAIVNAANSRLLGCWVPMHRCIDNAIHSAAGLQLRQECAELMAAQGHDEPTGTAKITKGYNLPSSHVIHTVGPIVPDGVPTRQQENELAGCYRSCLDLAAANGCHSIAFCCISTGEFRFPNRRAAEIAVRTAEEWQRVNATMEMRVIFNVFKDMDYEIYRELLGQG